MEKIFFQYELNHKYETTSTTNTYTETTTVLLPKYNKTNTTKVKNHSSATDAEKTKYYCWTRWYGTQERISGKRWVGRTK